MKYIVIVNSIEVQLAATKIKYVHSIPIQCWVNVADVGSTFHRYRVDVGDTQLSFHYVINFH